MNTFLDDAASTLTLADQIARQIAAKIVSGLYAEGESIPEQSIAELFSVSRGPVREALRILEHEGLVTILPRKGARVTSLTAEEVAELFDIRSVLFGLAARLCAVQFDEVNGGHLMMLMRRVKAFRPNASNSLTEYSEISAELANAVVRAAGNQRLKSMIDPVVFQVQRYSLLGLSSATRQRESIASWSALQAAFSANDASEAERIAREMVDRTGAFAASRLSANGKAGIRPRAQATLD